MTARFLIAIPATVLFLMTSFVDAQTPGQQERGGGAGTVNLTMEQRHIIKEYVTDMKVEKTEADAKLSVGDKIPDKVELRALPIEVGQKVPQVKSHLFFVTQNQVVLVDPKDKTVAEVIN